jgi:hypothetical protein
MTRSAPVLTATRVHTPFRSGYFESSNACAPTGIDSAAANPIMPAQCR